MKLTKKMLRKMILEEAKLMKEYGNPNDPGDRAVGMYFDVRMMESLGSLMDDMFHNAMESAAEDGLMKDEAYEMIVAGFEKLVEENMSDMRY